MADIDRDALIARKTDTLAAIGFASLRIVDLREQAATIEADVLAARGALSEIDAMLAAVDAPPLVDSAPPTEPDAFGDISPEAPASP